MDAIITEPSPETPRALDNLVLTFSRHWHLHGVYLRCTSCGAGQKASEAHVLFVHEGTCVNADSLHYPWQVLGDILHWMPSDNVIYI